MPIAGATYRDGVAYIDGALCVIPTGSASITGGNTWFVPTGGSSFAAVSGAADTNENTLATVTIPILSAKSIIRVTTHWSITNNANPKTARIKLGATTYLQASLANTLSYQGVTLIANRDVTNSQVGTPAGTNGGYGIVNSAVVTASMDTTATSTLTITAQKGTGTDTMTLEGYLVEILKP
jgi:hypothetical protein